MGKATVSSLGVDYCMHFTDSIKWSGQDCRSLKLWDCSLNPMTNPHIDQPPEGDRVVVLVVVVGGGLSCISLRVGLLLL